MITLEQLKETEERKNALHRYLDIDSKRIQVEEEELRTHVPDFWNDQKKAEAQMRKIKEIRFWIEGYTEVEKAVEELQLAFEFIKEGIVEDLFASLLEKRRSLRLQTVEFIEKGSVIGTKLTDGAVDKASPFSGAVLNERQMLGTEQNHPKKA